MQALIADDELGFHGGVLVVLGDPVGYALGEGIVVEGVGAQLERGQSLAVRWKRAAAPAR